MWLRDDLDQLKTNWQQSPWWVKLWMVVSFFLAISSLASLSETVTDWKGFFLDAIKFYRNYVSIPVQKFCAGFGMNYSRDFWDSMLLYNVSMGVFFRSLWVYAENIGHFLLKMRVFLAFLSMIFLSNCIYLMQRGYIQNFFEKYPENPENHILEKLLSPVFMLATVLFILVISAMDAQRRRDSCMKLILRLFAVQFIFIFFVVGVLGAVSSGLST